MTFDVTTSSDVSRQFRAAFLDAITTAINDPDVQIVRGHPGPNQADDIVALLDVSVQQEVATMGTRRQREMTITATVRFSVNRQGGPDRQAVAEDRAYELSDRVEEYVRATDTTVGGTVRWCFCISHEFDPLASLDVSASRLVEVDSVFVAKSRISS